MCNSLSCMQFLDTLHYKIEFVNESCDYNSTYMRWKGYNVVYSFFKKICNVLISKKL